jgi:hypothetical protein
MRLWGIGEPSSPRSDRSLTALDALRASVDRLAWHGVHSDGWQVVQIHRGPQGWDSTSLPADWERLFVAVMEQTGNRGLAAVVMDSDGAQLNRLQPKSGPVGRLAEDLFFQLLEALRLPSFTATES